MPTPEDQVTYSALRESEERFARFAASSSDALWVRDATTFAFQYVSPAVERIYGVTPQQVLADAELINELIVPEQRAAISANILRIATGEEVVQEYQIQRATDGELRWIRSTGFPLRNKDGEVDRLGAIAQDVTERKRSEAAVRKSEERQAFLLHLSDALRAESSVDGVAKRAIHMLYSHLQLDRCYITFYRPADDAADIVYQFGNDSVPPLPSMVRLSDFPEAYEQVREKTFVVDDDFERRGLSEAERESSRALGMRAMLASTLRQGEGNPLCSMMAVSSRPRTWSSDDIAVVNEAAERTFAAMERARSETAIREHAEELRVALEAGRMGTYRLILSTGKQRWSDQQYEIFGLDKNDGPPDRDSFLSLVHPEDHHLIEFTPDDIRTPGTFLDSEFRIIRPDGQQRMVMAHALALFDTKGHPSELIGVNLDVTEQRQLEAAMHSSEERLREFGEASSDVMWIRGARNLQWEYLSPAFHKIYGISRQDALRGDNYSSWLDLILPDDRDHALKNIEKVRQGERATFEYRIRRPQDAQIRWLRNTDFPMFDDNGQVVRIGGIGHDITPLKEAEEHQRLLTAELQHRVRNTLAVIRSIVRRTAISSRTLEDFTINLSGRIDAFARVQSMVTRDPASGVDLATLIVESLGAASAREGPLLTVDGPDVQLMAKPAETVGLGIHELVTNAIKHGALAEDGRRIDIRWSLKDASLILRWKESGVSIADRSPPTGLGTEILTRTLPYELGGKANFVLERDGLLYELSIPVRNLKFVRGTAL